MADSESSSYDGFLSYSHAADDLLAPRLQAGLQRFAKPWWKRRALRVFRDEASLSANPHLWSSITEALDDSNWFVLLLSPDAAGSEWVNREIDYWTEHKDAGRILPVVTDGEFGWSEGDVAGDAVPASLRDVFGDEPRWVDLRFARTETQLDLRHVRFRDTVADIAAAIRGVPKDELASEEVRQHRRTVRTAWTAGVAILALGIAATVGAVIALNAQQDAQDNAALAQEERDRAVIAEETATEERDRAVAAEEEAEQQRTLAEQEAARAEQQAARAEEQAAIAQANAELARSRELAGSAINVLEESPELSVLLALEATAGTDPPFESVSALHEALQKHRAVRTVYRPAEWERSVGLFGLISPDGKYMAISGLRHQLGVWDLESGAAEPLWEFEVPYPDHAVVFPYFSIDGSQVVATVAWFNRDVSQLPEPSAETGIYLFDTLTGEIIRHIRGPRCPPIGLFQNGRFIDTDRPLGVATPSADDCSVDNLADLSLIDLTTGETTLAYDQPVFAWDYEPSASLSDDGRYLAFTHDNLSTVVDLDAGAQAIEKPGGWYAKLTGDGSRLLAAQERTVSLWDIDNGTEIWTIEAPLALNDVRFNDDDTYVIAGAHDGVVRVWDATSGEILHELHGLLSFSWIISMTHDHTLIASASANAMRVWDLSPNAEGEVAGFDIPGASLLQAGKMVDDRGAILRYPDALSELQQPGTAMVMNVASNEVEFQFPDTYGGHLVRLSPNERLLAGQPFVGPGLLGPIHIRDVASGEVLVELQDLCTFDVTVKALGSDCADRPTAKADQVSGIDFSPDGSMIAIGGADEGIVGVWEVETGQRLAWLDLPGLRGADHAVVQFSPSADLLMAATTEIHIYSTDDWSQVASFPIDWGIWDAQFTQDGRYLLAADATEGAIITIDTNTWNQVGPALVGHEGAARDIDLNSDGSIIASGGSDGKVLIWDRESGDLLQSIPVGSSATLVDFITDQHLLIIPEGRPALVMTIEVTELIDIARSRITRGFTADECATYRIDPCPSLAAIRGGD